MHINSTYGHDMELHMWTKCTRYLIFHVLGVTAGTDNMQKLEPTFNTTFAMSAPLAFQHGQIVDITIECTNQLGLSTQKSVDQTIASQDPESENAYVLIHPRQISVFEPRGDIQAEDKTFEFEFHGFEDPLGIVVKNIICSLCVNNSLNCQNIVDANAS